MSVFLSLDPKNIYFIYFFILNSLDTFIPSSSSLPVRVFTSIPLLVVIRLLYPVVNFRCLSYMLGYSSQYPHFGRYTLKLWAGVSSTLLQISIFLYALLFRLTPCPLLCPLVCFLYLSYYILCYLDQHTHLHLYAHSVSAGVSSVLLQISILLYALLYKPSSQYWLSYSQYFGLCILLSTELLYALKFKASSASWLLYSQVFCCCILWSTSRVPHVISFAIQTSILIMFSILRKTGGY